MSFSDDVDKKIIEEYKAYEQGYQSLHNEKENEINSIVESKISDEQDDILQGLIAEKENIEREIISIKKTNNKREYFGRTKTIVR